MYKILLADLDLIGAQESILSAYEIDIVYNIDDFYNFTYEKHYDIYIANYYYYDVVKELNLVNSKTKTLFIDEYYDIHHLKKAFEIADDYIIKPLNFQELVIRIEYQLKKLYSVKKEIVTYKDMYFHIKSKQLYRKNTKVKLSPNEAKLLEYFLCQMKTPLHKEHILDYLESSSDGTLRVYISKLNKIGFHISYERINLSYTLI